MAIASSQNRTGMDDTRSSTSSLSDKASDFASKAGYQVDKALDSAEETARSIAEQGRDAGERVAEVAGNLKTAVTKSVQDQPMATLAVAAAMGFVLGALWKS